MPKDNTNCRSIASRIFCRSLVRTNRSSPSVKYLSDSAGRSVCAEFFFSGATQRRIFCKLKPWRVKCLTTFRQIKSLKEYRRRVPRPSASLIDGRIKSCSSQYCNWRRLTPTIRLAVLLSYVSIPDLRSNENKAVFMKVDWASLVVNKIAIGCDPWRSIGRYSEFRIQHSESSIQTPVGACGARP